MSWFTKIVEVEKVVEQPVPGEASRATLYAAYEDRRETTKTMYGDYSHTVEATLGYYLSCADAFKAHPGLKVEQVPGIRIGSEYFAVSGLKPVNVAKPKRGKGKASGAA